MPLRKDSLGATAEVILAVEKAATGSVTGTTVGTVGLLNNEPNVANVIPGRTFFSLDIRDIDPSCLETTAKHVLKEVVDVAQRRGISCEVQVDRRLPPVALSPRLRSALVDSAIEQEIAYLEMPSGAAHDTQELTRIADVGMIFVPSIEGRSHCPEEDTPFESIAMGVDVLLGAVKRGASH